MLVIKPHIYTHTHTHTFTSFPLGFLNFMTDLKASRYYIT